MVRYRTFSPAQNIVASTTKEGRRLAQQLACSHMDDVSDAALLNDPTALSTAARVLEGTAVKLLPDCR